MRLMTVAEYADALAYLAEQDDPEHVRDVAGQIAAVVAAVDQSVRDRALRAEAQAVAEAAARQWGDTPATTAVNRHALAGAIDKHVEAVAS